MEQLEYMLNELNTNPLYTEAANIFYRRGKYKNQPFTRRQLMRASEIFWVYGVEGDRYTKSGELLQQQGITLNE